MNGMIASAFGAIESSPRSSPVRELRSSPKRGFDFKELRRLDRELVEGCSRIERRTHPGAEAESADGDRPAPNRPPRPACALILLVALVLPSAAHAQFRRRQLRRQRRRRRPRRRFERSLFAVDAAGECQPPTPTATAGLGAGDLVGFARGPRVTFIGIASPDGRPAPPLGSLEDGTPVYFRNSGFGFNLVDRGQPRRRAARRSAPRSSNRPTAIRPGGRTSRSIVDRPLGDGSRDMCDEFGVPAVAPARLSRSPSASADAINDLACRFEVATRATPPAPRYASASSASCRRTTRAQFCLSVGSATAVPQRRHRAHRPGARPVRPDRPGAEDDAARRRTAPFPPTFTPMPATFTPTPSSTATVTATRHAHPRHAERRPARRARRSPSPSTPTPHGHALPPRLRHRTRTATATSTATRTPTGPPGRRPRPDRAPRPRRPRARTPGPSPTASRTATRTATATPTPVQTPTRTRTPTRTATRTATALPTATRTRTQPPTPTITATPAQALGPQITFFGLDPRRRRPHRPSGKTQQGSTVYEPLFGSAFSIVVEAKPGTLGAPRRQHDLQRVRPPGSADPDHPPARRRQQPRCATTCRRTSAASRRSTRRALPTTRRSRIAQRSRLPLHRRHRATPRPRVRRDHRLRARRRRQFGCVSPQTTVQFCGFIAQAGRVPRRRHGSDRARARRPGKHGAAGPDRRTHPAAAIETG